MINTVCIMGRLTYEPEVKTTHGGLSVVRFQVAVDRGYVPQGQERKADFIDCVAWRSTAEFISRHFHKGQMIAIEGSIQTQNYTDKNGSKRKSVEVVCNNVIFCGDKKNAVQGVTEDEKPNVNADDYEEIEDDDNLPF